MTTADLLITHASQLCVVPAASGGHQRSADLGELGLILDGALAIRPGHGVAAGPTAALRAQFSAAHEIDAAGRVAIPGFVDPHTHVVWAGDRASEFEMRVAGKMYMEIMAAGGGICAFAPRPRLARRAGRASQAAPRADAAHGTTTVGQAAMASRPPPKQRCCRLSTVCKPSSPSS
jgi:imidazolonepropionase